MEKPTKQHIEQEKRDYPYVKDLVEVFFSDEGDGLDLVRDTDEFIENICVHEDELVKLEESKNRRIVYMHYIRNSFAHIYDEEK